VPSQDSGYVADFAPREPIVLSELYEARRAVQTENSLTTMPVDMDRALITKMHHNFQSTEFEN